MISGEFQNEQKVIYVLLTHPLFRCPDSQKTTFLQTIPLVLVSVYVREAISNATSFLQSFELSNVLPT